MDEEGSKGRKAFHPGLEYRTSHRKVPERAEAGSRKEQGKEKEAIRSQAATDARGLQQGWC